MVGKTRIWLLVCVAVVLPGGVLASAAGADEPSPVVPPVDVQGIVEGTVETATGALTEATAPVTGGGSSPAAPAQEPTPGGQGEVGQTVGKVVTEATATAKNGAKAVQEVAKTVTGAGQAPTSGSHKAAPTDTGSTPAAASVPAPAEEASPAPVAPPSAEPASPSTSPRSVAPRGRATGTPSVGDPVPVAQARRSAEEADPAASVRAALAGAVKTIAAEADGAFEALPSSAADPGSASSGSSDDRGANGHGSSRPIYDLTPGGALGTLILLLVLGAGAAIVAVVMRKEIGLGILPRRRYRG